ncbi:hypothetical protein [Nocardioides sp. W7]|uniref:hypothetical protein n=1 Tax=Nocardioides sp. W7 TaxID=2931390 RepID=UPI001FD4CC6E|nr:hypothetical protein [Nocardioides sp. W7]
MTARTLGIALALAVAGAVGGYAVGAVNADEPRTISMALPVPAASPSYPVNEYDVKPDPDDPALKPGLALVETRLSAAGSKLVTGVPTAWKAGGEGNYRTFVVAGNPLNTYQLRVGIFTDKQSVGVKRIARLGALDEAEDNDALQNLVVESETDDGFVASYLQHGYRRVTMERFLTLGGTSAYATVAVIGREIDRPGLEDLLARVSGSLRVP